MRTWHRDGELITEAGHATDLIAADAVRWIESRGDRPFFLYVPFTAVHLPLKEPQEWLARVPAGIQGDVPRHYAASIMHMDDAVGRIIEALSRAGRRENTLLVFTSDNGGSTAENNDLKYPDDNCPNGKLTGNNLPLRGRKGDVHEGGTRVPTIVSWPARAKPGKVETPVQITDWMPTFCALAGYQPASDLNWDGTDLTAVLLKHEPLPARPLYTVGPGWRARSLRYGDWKLIVQGQGEGAKVELFNIASDPGESKNLAETQPQQAAEMLAHLQEAAKRDRDSIAKP
jgi:arylsulfatase A-like enzyme